MCFNIYINFNNSHDDYMRVHSPSFISFCVMVFCFVGFFHSASFISLCVIMFLIISYYTMMIVVISFILLCCFVIFRGASFGFILLWRIMMFHCFLFIMVFQTALWCIIIMVLRLFRGTLIAWCFIIYLGTGCCFMTY